MDQFGLKRIVHLCPQTAHDHVDYVRVGFESYVPHMLCNFVPRYNLTRRMRQMSEQEKLFRREIQRNTAALGALMMHCMLETILAARLMGVDPFDQPAVELAKVITRERMTKG